LQQDPETGELVFILVHGELQQELPGRRIPGDAGVAGWVAVNRTPVIVNEPRQDWRFSFQVDEEFAFLTQSIMCLPLEAGERLLGVMELVNKEPPNSVRRIKYWCLFCRRSGVCAGDANVLSPSP
jgi:GAF domain-containing protein